MTTLNNSLISLTFSLAVKAVKVWFSTKGLEVNPLIEEWVKHFFFGGGEEKTLPPEAIEETKKAVLKSLQFLWSYPSWEIHTASVGEKYGMEGWLCTLKGVIGAFTYTLIPEETGVMIKCWDLWDFNIDKEGLLLVELPTPLRASIKKIASMLNIELIEQENCLLVQESELAKLNEGRQFYTKWEFFLTWKELKGIGMKHPMLHKWEHGGLPLEWFIKNTP